MNELIFISHIFIVVSFVLIGLRLGKNSLIALIALSGILANLFVVKQSSLFGFSVTCSDVFAVGGILGLNLLQEYYGKEAAKEGMRIAFLSLVFFAIMSQMHLLYIPIPQDTTDGAFQTIFSSSFRIISASVVTFNLVQKFDVNFFGILKGNLAARMVVSMVLSEFLDTILFSYLGLYGIVESLSHVILLSFLTKCLVIALSAPFIAFSKRIVKHVPI